MCNFGKCRRMCFSDWMESVSCENKGKSTCVQTYRKWISHLKFIFTGSDNLPKISLAGKDWGVSVISLLMEQNKNYVEKHSPWKKTLLHNHTNKEDLLETSHQIWNDQHNTFFLLNEYHQTNMSHYEAIYLFTPILVAYWIR